MNFASVSGKNWIFNKFNSSDIKKYSEDYSLNEIVAKLLSIRKKNIEDISLFLNPTIKNLLPNPLCLKDMDNAIERTYQSVKKKELTSLHAILILILFSTLFVNSMVDFSLHIPAIQYFLSTLSAIGLTKFNTK